MSSQKLVDCFRKSNLSSCYVSRGDAAEVLAKRGHAHWLIRKYQQGDTSQRDVLVIALAQINEPEVLSFMRKIAFQNLTNEPDGEPRWYALQYLAERCDKRALARFNRDVNWRHGYPIGCMYWTGTVRQFGTCQYRPAIPHLIDYTNSVACLNISEAAVESLEKLYPGKCKDTKSFNQAHDCYLREYKKEKQNKVR